MSASIPIDEPVVIPKSMQKVKGLIRTKATIKGVAFAKDLLPVLNARYGLHDLVMLNKSRTVVGAVTAFTMEQDPTPERKWMPPTAEAL